jgi:hypothetical protein
MKIFAVILLIIGTLFVVSENGKAAALFFYASSFLAFLSYLANSSLEKQSQHTKKIKKHTTSRTTSLAPEKNSYVKDNSHLTTTVGGVGIAASLLDDTDASLTADESTSIFDDDIGLSNSIDNSFDEIETTYVNPATGLPMIGGIGGIDAGGDVYGSDLMSDMHSGIDSSSMFSDDLTSSTDSFDSFDSSSSISDDSFGTDDSFSSFDDSFSSMNDDW